MELRLIFTECWDVLLITGLILALLARGCWAWWQFTNWGE